MRPQGAQIRVIQTGAGDDPTSPPSLGRVGRFPRATLLSIIPLLVALLSGIFAYIELRKALTFDARAFNAIAVRTRAMRFAQDADVDVRSYNALRRPAQLADLRAQEAGLKVTLPELLAVTTDLGVTGGRRLVDDLAELHQRWSADVARPLTSERLTPRRREAVLALDTTLLAAYRTENRGLNEALHARIMGYQKSSAGPLSRIVLLFLASIAACALGTFFGARRLLRVDRERERAEAALHEREVLHKRDRSWARSFQRAVLPPGLPVVLGCRFDAVYEPGESESHVGGDWYDAVRLIDGRILVSIGDVAGSGVEAAVVMGVARQIMRGIAQVHADPALMLDAADRALRIEHSDVFVTAWVGVIDLVTRSLTYSSAGHPPALLVGPDGTLDELRDLALPLGLRQGHEGSSTTVALADGAMLTLYTDGLTEATRDVIMGETRVRSAARETAAHAWSAPAGELQRRVLTDGSIDDVAILVAQFDFEQAERYFWRARFDGRDASAAHATRALLLDVLQRREFRPLESMNAELVFGELIGNVVRHVEGPLDVDIVIDCSGPQTVLHVLDRGAGFRHTSRLPSDLYAESGRGLFIIAALTQEFTVSERPGGGSHARATLAGGSSRPLAHAGALADVPVRTSAAPAISAR